LGTRFRKSFGFGPLRFTLSKGGVSVSTGIPGLRLTRRADGKMQSTIGIPGSGLSVVNVHSSGSSRTAAVPSTPSLRGLASAFVACVLLAILSYVFGWIGFVGGLALVIVYRSAKREVERKADAAARIKALAASAEPIEKDPAFAFEDSGDDPYVGEILTFEIEKRAAQERRRVWIQYEDNNENETERNIEIYNAGDDDYVHGWCCLRRGPRTFRRERILHWRLLDERFEFNAVLEKWWQEEYPKGDEKMPWADFRKLHA